MTRYNDLTPAALTAIHPRHPRHAVSPRIRPTVDPLPVEWRQMTRAIRLAVASLLCAARGHDWDVSDVHIVNIWQSVSGRYDGRNQVVRRCIRCGFERTTVHRSVQF